MKRNYLYKSTAYFQKYYSFPLQKSFFKYFDENFASTDQFGDVIKYSKTTFLHHFLQFLPTRITHPIVLHFKTSLYSMFWNPTASKAY